MSPVLYCDISTKSFQIRLLDKTLGKNDPTQEVSQTIKSDSRRYSRVHKSKALLLPPPHLQLLKQYFIFGTFEVFSPSAAFRFKQELPQLTPQGL